MDQSVVLENLSLVEQVAEVDTGMTGLERLEEQSVNLVVTDYNMPDMDSQRLVDCIRNRRADPTLPVLMVTCERDDARLLSTRQSGASGLCHKPFNLETARDILRRLLE